MISVQFAGYSCEVAIEQYPTKLKRIQLYTMGNPRMPVATATVNLPEAAWLLPKSHVLIKDYAENSGILDALIEAGVISEPLDQIFTDYASVQVCQLLM